MSERPEEAWARIEPQQLAALSAVAAHGSVTAAAARLGVDAPLLRRRIAALEEVVGAALLHRGALTEAGEVVAGHAERIAAEARAADRALGDRDPEAP